MELPVNAFSAIGPSAHNSPELPSEYLELRWYAVYTCANREKQVAAQLSERRIENFLPVYESVRQWKDRRVRLYLPLFSGYLFIHLALRDRIEVLRVPSVVRLVSGHRGMPEALPDQEITVLRAALASGVRAEPHRYLTIGRRVRIKRGPLAGMEGILQRRKGKYRVVLSVDLITRSIVVEANADDLELPSAANRPMRRSRRPDADRAPRFASGYSR